MIDIIVLAIQSVDLLFCRTERCTRTPSLHPRHSTANKHAKQQAHDKYLYRLRVHPALYAIRAHAKTAWMRLVAGTGVLHDYYRRAA